MGSRAPSDLTRLGQAQQIRAIVVLAIRMSKLDELFTADPTVVEGDFLGNVDA
jgi:hypothetical protein